MPDTTPPDTPSTAAPDALPAFTAADHEAVAYHVARNQTLMHARESALRLAIEAHAKGLIDTADAADESDLAAVQMGQVDEILATAEQFVGYILEGPAPAGDADADATADTSAGPGLTDGATASAPPLAA